MGDPQKLLSRFAGASDLEHADRPSGEPVRSAGSGPDGSSVQRDSDLCWERWTDDQIGEPVVRATYRDTGDCPAWDAYRTAAQTLAGYRHQPNHWAGGWWIAKSPDGRPIGVLILGYLPPGPESDREDGLVFELTYLGLSPPFRGRGLGRSMLRKAIEIAQGESRRRSSSFRAIYAAIDRTNDSARRLYERDRFERCDGESVWVLESPER